jgi:2,5-diamino-6-(ribosylamino)-4(3H)-pyrimidinone 5'-phosphate reductase
MPSRSGQIPPDHPLFHKPGGPIHLLVTGESRLATAPDATVHHASLGDFLETLATKHGVKQLHCEGGGTLIRSLVAMDVIDEFHLTLAGHTLFGGWSAPSAKGVPDEFLPRSVAFSLSHFEPRPDLGECFLTYRRSQ